MPFCASCGAQVEGKFCAKCGAAVVAGGSVPPPPPVQPVGPYATPVNPISAPMADNLASMLCYAAGLITGIIFLVLEPYSKNPRIRFHAFQSIFMSIAVIVIDIILGILLSGSLFGAVLFGLLWTLFRLACFLLWLFMLISTYQGKTIVLPVIGPLAQKQAQG